MKGEHTCPPGEKRVHLRPKLWGWEGLAVGKGPLQACTGRCCPGSGYGACTLMLLLLLLSKPRPKEPPGLPDDALRHLTQQWFSTGPWRDCSQMPRTLTIGSSVVRAAKQTSQLPAQSSTQRALPSVSIMAKKQWFSNSIITV